MSAAHLADSVARTRGVTFRSGLLNSMTFKGYNRKIQHPKSVFDWLSRDEETVSLYQSDEKCNFIFTASGFRDLFTLCIRANSNAVFRRTPRDLPLLFLAGDKDPVGRYGDGVSGYYGIVFGEVITGINFLRDFGAGIRNIDAIFYKNARHELLNELGRIETYGDISRWLEDRLTALSEHAAQSAEQA